jgi:ATP/maltotriose-dependent transcriptional regulator MalT
MSIATDVRSYADIALAQGKTALSQAGTAVATANNRLVSDAPKPAYAALGAADLVAARVTKRVEALPAETVENVSKAQQSGRSLITRTQSDALARLHELRGRLDAGLESVAALPVVARNTTGAYLSTAKDLYGKLTVRGEAKAAELRNDPRLSKLLGQAGEVAESVQGTVNPVVKSAFDKVQSANPLESKPARTAAPKAAVRKSPATKSITKSPATKSTTSKSTTSKSTTTRKPAVKRAPRKSSARKSTTQA